MSFYYRPTITDAFASVQLMTENNVLTASFGVTGYSLSWDQIGYWTVKILTIVPETIVVIGSSLIELLGGSASVVCGTIHFDSFL
ncbi:hypothetical protein DCAR_0727765 [Daucus carota subsp. sativus]|uniref:Cytochrome b/b6 N-terminal region profile domain-containing protein n=1 Tax=Daucus carota subsp. sativus TaxID=79200 RepID=A0AAF0XJU0_DAUCS|nr:hypothetical protein DCAR_0727765 [Daucus carota subsp. sativus]